MLEGLLVNNSLYVIHIHIWSDKPREYSYKMTIYVVLYRQAMQRKQSRLGRKRGY